MKAKPIIANGRPVDQNLSMREVDMTHHEYQVWCALQQIRNRLGRRPGFALVCIKRGEMTVRPVAMSAEKVD